MSHITQTIMSWQNVSRSLPHTHIHIHNYMHIFIVLDCLQLSQSYIMIAPLQAFCYIQTSLYSHQIIWLQHTRVWSFYHKLPTWRTDHHSCCTSSTTTNKAAATAAASAGSRHWCWCCISCNLDINVHQLSIKMTKVYIQSCQCKQTWKPKFKWNKT